ncbi:MAG: TIM-barrel domain-containing protein [Candidatus Dormibacteria bacterium]
MEPGRDAVWSGQFNARLTAQGIQPLSYVRAYICDDTMFDRSGTFQYALNNKFGVMDAAGQQYISVATGPALLHDFTNPDTVAWWDTKLRNMLDLGFNGFMQDFGEQVLSDMHFKDGSTGAAMHNRYTVLYHQVTRKFIDGYMAQHPGRHIFFYTRAGYSGRPGAAGYENSNFPGDEATNWGIAGGLGSLTSDLTNRGVGGAPGFNTDVGGYANFTTPPTDKELFLRWAEWAALTPFYRVHMDGAAPLMPWDFGQGAVDVYRRLPQFHNDAVPLLQGLWTEQQSDGIPIDRPLWLQYPKDPASVRQDQEYTLGNDILVAPVVTAGATTRAVYFPPDCWQDPRDAHVYQGPMTATVAAPLDQLPYFYRCGTSPLGPAYAVARPGAQVGSLPLTSAARPLISLATPAALLGCLLLAGLLFLGRRRPY